MISLPLFAKSDSNVDIKHCLKHCLKHYVVFEHGVVSMLGGMGAGVDEELWKKNTILDVKF